MSQSAEFDAGNPCEPKCHAYGIGCQCTPPPVGVVTEWAVDMGFTIQRVSDEATALRWVQSYADHPEALDGDPMPVAVSRTVTTTGWTRPISPG